MSASNKLLIGEIVGLVLGLFGATGHIPVASANDITTWIVETVTGAMAFISLVSFLEHLFHLVKAETNKQAVVVTGVTTQV